MPRGGRRPNAGRKPDQTTVEFRDYWRSKLDSPGGRTHLWQRAKKSDAILAKLLDKSFPNPLPSVTELPVGDIILLFGKREAPLNLGYRPMGQVPGMEKHVFDPVDKDR